MTKPARTMADVREIGQRRAIQECGTLSSLGSFNMDEAAFDEGARRWHAAFTIKCPFDRETWRMRIVVDDATGTLVGFQREIVGRSGHERL